MNAVCSYYLHVLQETSEAGSKTSESLFVLLFTIFLPQIILFRYFFTKADKCCQFY